MSPSTEQIFAVCHFDSAARAQQAVSELQQIGVDSSAVKTISGDSLSGMAANQVQQQFLSAGVHQEDASYLEQELRQKGGVLAIIRTTSANEAKVDQILTRYGAHETDEYKTGQTTGKQATGDQTLKVVEEELVVGKRAVVRGGMRIYSRIIERPVEENISLTEESVHVDRQKVNRPISTAEVDALARGQVLEATTTGEEAVVSKKARVVEEVSIGKEASQRTETVRDTVRKTDVQVEKIDSDVDAYFQKDFQTQYGKSGGDYTSYQPAYQHGYTMASDPQYKGKSYSDVEKSLRSSYESNNPGSTWDKVKGAVQTGWNKVTGK